MPAGVMSPAMAETLRISVVLMGISECAERIVQVDKRQSACLLSAVIIITKINLPRRSCPGVFLVQPALPATHTFISLPSISGRAIVRRSVLLITGASNGFR